METVTWLLLAAAISVAQCGPLGQTTVCESAQSAGPAAVYETFPGVLPNILPYLYGLQGAFAPPLYNNIGLPYPLPYPATGSATVCESTPNIVGLGAPGALGLGNYPLGLPLGMPYGRPSITSAAVCENVPNLLGVGALGYPYPLAGGLGSSTVCESSPNVVGLGSYGVPLSGLPLGGLPLGGLPLGGLPLGGLPLGGLPLGGLPLNGLGLSPAIPFL